MTLISNLNDILKDNRSGIGDEFDDACGIAYECAVSGADFANSNHYLIIYNRSNMNLDRNADCEQNAKFARKKEDQPLRVTRIPNYSQISSLSTPHPDIQRMVRELFPITDFDQIHMFEADEMPLSKIRKILDEYMKHTGRWSPNVGFLRGPERTIEQHLTDFPLSSQHYMLAKEIGVRSFNAGYLAATEIDGYQMPIELATELDAEDLPAHGLRIDYVATPSLNAQIAQAHGRILTASSKFGLRE